MGTQIVSNGVIPRSADYAMDQRVYGTNSNISRFEQSDDIKQRFAEIQWADFHDIVRERCSFILEWNRFVLEHPVILQ